MKLTVEQRLLKPCRKGHPLSARYIQRRQDKPGGNLRCHHCDADWDRGVREMLPMEIVQCFPDKRDAARQIAAVLLDVDAPTVGGWLHSRRAEPWRIRQIIAAMELGLITHVGAPPDEPIPYDAEIDIEPCNLSQSS